MYWQWRVRERRGDTTRRDVKCDFIRWHTNEQMREMRKTFIILFRNLFSIYWTWTTFLCRFFSAGRSKLVLCVAVVFPFADWLRCAIVTQLDCRVAIYDFKVYKKKGRRGENIARHIVHFRSVNTTFAKSNSNSIAFESIFFRFSFRPSRWKVCKFFFCHLHSFCKQL